MRFRGLRDRRGTTLAECLVALAIFGITAGMLSRLLTSHIRREVTNATTSTAITLAEAELEDLRALDYPEIVGRSNTTTVRGITYSINTTVVADTPAYLMKSITTTVSWNEPAGPQLVTLYAIYTDVTR